MVIMNLECRLEMMQEANNDNAIIGYYTIIGF